MALQLTSVLLVLLPMILPQQRNSEGVQPVLSLNQWMMSHLHLLFHLQNENRCSYYNHPSASTAAATNYQIAISRANQSYNSNINNYSNQGYTMLHLQHQWSGRRCSLYSSSELPTAITTTYGTSACGTDNDASSVADDEDNDVFMPPPPPTPSISTVSTQSQPIHIYNHTIIHHHAITINSTKFIIKQHIAECSSGNCSSARSCNIINTSNNFLKSY